MAGDAERPDADRPRAATHGSPHPYHLGIDAGTTFTAAAIHRGSATEIVPLGNQAATIPSAVFLKPDGSMLIGGTAVRRGLSEPERMATQFKRRLGDSAPLLLGGTPYSAQALTGKLLRWVVDKVTELEGGPPHSIAITHPANWGAYKLEILQQAIELADLEVDVLLTEPEAAAIYYAAAERVDDGSAVAVYDLGGGTFDAAVLRKIPGGWEVLGSPAGIEHLGGVDVDEAVFHHVRQAIISGGGELDLNAPETRSALARLRREFVEAKEALSSDTDVNIAVLLPGHNTEVRLTRSELESMITPTLSDTTAALRRALRSVPIDPADVSAVLLVGGSSRIPLIAEMVSQEFGRPIAIDAHPKHAVALGAAVSAANAAPTPTVGETQDTGTIPVALASTSDPAAVGGEVTAEDEVSTADDPGVAQTPVPGADSGWAPPVAPAATPDVQPETVSSADRPIPLPTHDPEPLRRRLPAVVGGLSLLFAVVLIIVNVFGGENGGDDDIETEDDTAATEDTTEPTAAVDEGDGQGIEAVAPFFPPDANGGEIIPCGGYGFRLDAKDFRDAFNDQLNIFRDDGTTTDIIAGYEEFTEGEVERANTLTVADIAPNAAEGEEGTLLQELQSSGSITIGLANEIPFGFIDDNDDPAGIAPDVASVVLAELGITDVDAEVVNFGELISGLQAGAFDLIAAGMFINDDRAQQILFSDPDYCIAESLAIAAGNPEGIVDYASFVDNPNLILAVVDGTVEVVFAEDAGIPGDQVEVFPSIDDMFAALEAGDVDAATGTAATVQREVDARTSG